MIMFNDVAYNMILRMTTWRCMFNVRDKERERANRENGSEGGRKKERKSAENRDRR